MEKRQDARHTRFRTAGWLAIALFLLLACTGCQARINPTPIEPTTAVDMPYPTAANSDLTRATNTPIFTAPSATPTVDCLQQGGTLESSSFFSEHIGENFHFRAYLPPCYGSNPIQRYPVLYLLHGLTYDEEQWIRLGVADRMDDLIASGAISPFIVILPGEARFLLPQNSPFQDALVQELVPWVDQVYRTQPEKAYRAIGGLSRGAAWAVRIGFDHYQTFSRVGAHSLPLFEVDSSRLATWIAQIPVEEMPEFFIDIGRGDPERHSAQAFADQLNANNIPHTWYLFNGSHTEEYWAAHLENYLLWYAHNW